MFGVVACLYDSPIFVHLPQVSLNIGEFTERLVECSIRNFSVKRIKIIFIKIGKNICF